MKVLNLMGMSSTKFGGIEKFNIEMIQQGVDIAVVYDSKPLSSHYISLMKTYDMPLYVCDSSNVFSIFNLLRIIIRESPNIIHYHFSGIVYYLISIFVAICLPGIKQIHTIHCEPVKYKGLRGFLSKLFYRCQDQIIAVSSGVYDGFIQLFGAKYNIIVSYLGVQRGQVKHNNLREMLNIKPNTVVITSIGWDIHIKGYDVLLESIVRLVDAGIRNDFILILIGLPEKEEKALKVLIAEHKLDNLCLSVGIREDIDEFLNITDIYVQPSRTEAISLSIMEALQYGIPIIGSDVGGIPEVCINHHNGLLFERENADDLYNKLKYLISSPEVRAKFSANSYDLSKQFLRPERVKSLKRIYKGLL